MSVSRAVYFAGTIMVGSFLFRKSPPCPHGKVIIMLIANIKI
jgi:hypothetical protein